jgi:hypothetical protein
LTQPLPSEVDFSTPFGLKRAAKDALLLDGLTRLTEWHRARCPDYRRVIGNVYGNGHQPATVAEVPFLPVGLFKHSRLASVPEDAIRKTLTSSGTTGQKVSRIFVDAETARLQIRALSAIVQDFIGTKRLPFVSIDRSPGMASSASHTARTAGVLGFATFGCHHFHLLSDDLQPKWSELERYLAEHAGEGMLVFGFTYMVWQHLIVSARHAGVRLDFGPDTILIHGGGWKRLADRQVSNQLFKDELWECFGIRRVSNYYGMVEQVGSIYMECDEGYLHAPSFAEVLFRDPITLRPADEGVIQVLSLLPRSYPGHSILTEDVGISLGVDTCPCGRLGRYFCVRGRLPAAEARGCSDVAA